MKNTATISIEEYDTLRDIAKNLNQKEEELRDKFNRYGSSLRKSYEAELKKIKLYEESNRAYESDTRELKRSIQELTDKLHFSRFFLVVSVGVIIVGVIVLTFMT